MDDFFNNIETESIECGENSALTDSKIKLGVAFDMRFAVTSENKTLTDSIETRKKMLQLKLKSMKFKDSEDINIIIDDVILEMCDITYKKYRFNFSFDRLFGSPDDLLAFLNVVLNSMKIQNQYVGFVFFTIEENGTVVASEQLILDEMIKISFCHMCKYLVYGTTDEDYCRFLLKKPDLTEINKLITKHLKLLCDRLLYSEQTEDIQDMRFKRNFTSDVPYYDEYKKEMDFFYFGNKKPKRVPIGFPNLISSDNNVQMSLCVTTNNDSYNISEIKKYANYAKMISEYIANSRQLMRQQNRKVPIYYNTRDTTNDYILRTVYLGSVYSSRYGIIHGSIGLYGPVLDVINTMKQIYHITKDYLQ